MISKKKNYLIISLIITLFASNWFFYQLDIGGRTITNVPEAIILLILLWVVIFKRKSPKIPINLKSILFILVLLGLLQFIFCLAIGIKIGPIIGSFRKLIVYPIIGIIIGFTFSHIDNAFNIILRTLYIYLYFQIFIIVINVMFNILPVQGGYGYLKRPDAIIISLILFIHLKNYTTGLFSNKDKYYILVSLLLVFLTASRGVYLSVFIGIAIILFQNRRKKYLKYIKIGAIFIVSGIIFYQIYTNPDIKKTIDKDLVEFGNFVSDDYEGYGANINKIGARYYRYLYILNLGMKNPIFGNGIGYNEEWYLAGKYKRYEHKTTHNYFLTIWYKLGLLGLIIIFSLIYKLLIIFKGNIIFQTFVIVSFFYGSLDVMLDSRPPAILSIFFIFGIFIGYQKLKKHNHNKSFNNFKKSSYIKFAHDKVT